MTRETEELLKQIAVYSFIAVIFLWTALRSYKRITRNPEEELRYEKWLEYKQDLLRVYWIEANKWDAKFKLHTFKLHDKLLIREYLRRVKSYILSKDMKDNWESYQKVSGCNPHKSFFEKRLKEIAIETEAYLLEMDFQNLNK